MVEVSPQLAARLNAEIERRAAASIRAGIARSSSPGATQKGRESTGR